MQRSHTRRLGQAGFSLIEILITMLIFSVVTIGLLVVFSNSSRLARSQTQLAMIQQGQRVGHSELVRYTRMAGAGGLPITRINVTADQISDQDYDLTGVLPHGLALGLYDNVKSDISIAQVVDGSAASDADGDGEDEPLVLPGSDVLIVRGVFTTPVYYTPGRPPSNMGCTTEISTWLAPDGKSAAGCITVPGRSRVVGEKYEDLHQDVVLLSEQLKAIYGRPAGQFKDEAFLLRDLVNPNAYAIMAFDWASVANEGALDPYKCPLPADAGASVTEDDMPLCLNLPLKIDLENGPGLNYADLTRGTSLLGGGGMTLIPDAANTDLNVELPTNISSLGFLEEFRFFLRVEREVPGDDSSRLTPVLSRARFGPGTNNLVDVIDIADNVIDLQLALGVDTDELGSGPGYGVVFEDGSDTDEVLFNAPGDYLGADADPPYANPPGGDPPDGHQVWFNPDLEYHFLRINTVVMADRRDVDYQAPELTNIEDFARGDSFSLGGDNYSYNDLDARRFRRRWLQTVVELRNLL